MNSLTQRESLIDELNHTRFDLPGQLDRVRRRVESQPENTDRTIESDADFVPIGKSRRRPRAWLAASWALLPIVAGSLVVLTVPSVRSFAEEVLVRFRDYFFERSTATEMGHDWEILGEFRIAESREDLAEATGIEVLVLPEGSQWPAFRNALVVGGERSAVIATYQGGGWTAHVFQQTLADAREHDALAFPLGVSGISNDAKIREVDVGPYSGQRVHGSWVGEDVWRDDWPVNRVRWSDNAFVYSVELRPHVPPGERIEMPSRRAMSREALRLARGLLE